MRQDRLINYLKNLCNSQAKRADVIWQRFKSDVSHLSPVHHETLNLATHEFTKPRKYIPDNFMKESLH